MKPNKAMYMGRNENGYRIEFIYHRDVADTLADIYRKTGVDTLVIWSKVHNKWALFTLDK